MTIVDTLIDVGLFFLFVAYILGFFNYLLGAMEAFEDDLLHGVGYLLYGPFWFFHGQGFLGPRGKWVVVCIVLGLLLVMVSIVVKHWTYLVASMPI